MIKLSSSSSRKYQLILIAGSSHRAMDQPDQHLQPLKYIFFPLDIYLTLAPRQKRLRDHRPAAAVHAIPFTVSVSCSNLAAAPLVLQTTLPLASLFIPPHLWQPTQLLTLCTSGVEHHPLPSAGWHSCCS